MFKVLSDPRYRKLFMAQMSALLGTGLATVALALMAYDLARDNAGLVLGGIFTLKMLAYVGIAPIAGALADSFDRRTWLISLDVLRAAAALCLPFVSEVWQVFALVFVFQAASAGFTPVFQATLPEILPDETDYTHALSLSRLAYDLENILTPILAGLLLAVATYGVLFWGTFLGFALSIVLILRVRFPTIAPAPSRGLYERTTRGARIYLATPRLRSLLALNLAVASAGAMVLVNTVVLVRVHLGLNESAVAWTMLAFGAGSITVALILPKLLQRWTDRPVMLAGAALMTAGLIGLILCTISVGLSWPAIWGAWFFIGIGYSAVLTPSARLLRRSAQSGDRPALFAAQFALSHAFWLLTYPLAGSLITTVGPVSTLVVLAVLTGLGALGAYRLWPDPDPTELFHSHPDLPLDHPHLQGSPAHSHAYVIDDLHPKWPDTDARERV